MNDGYSGILALAMAKQRSIGARDAESSLTSADNSTAQGGGEVGELDVLDGAQHVGPAAHAAVDVVRPRMPWWSVHMHSCGQRTMRYVHVHATL